MIPGPGNPTLELVVDDREHLTGGRSARWVSLSPDCCSDRRRLRRERQRRSAYLRHLAVDEFLGLVDGVGRDDVRVRWLGGEVRRRSVR